MKSKRTKLLMAINGLILVLMLTMISCGDDDGGDPGPVGTLTADAGTDQTVAVGDMVTLNASGSTDSDGDAFTYSWQFITTPAGSTVTLNNPTTATPTFTPDVAGTYTVELVISNEKGDSTDEVEITAEEDMAPEEIGGTISSNRTLENRITDPAKPDYIASSNVNVQADLIIKPGVKIVYESDVALNVTSEGALLAEGTATEPIVMTGTTESNGFWKGVGIFSSDVRNVMDYVEVYYAGSSEYGGGLYAKFNVGIESGDKMKVTNSTISQSGDYGLYVESGGELLGFANNAFENNVGIPLAIDANNMTHMDANSSFIGNGDQYVELHGSTLNLGTEATWRAFSDGTPYWITGNVSIQSGVQITEGVVMEFGSDIRMTVESTGYIIAKGTEANRVKFLGKAGAPGSWKGVHIYTNDTKNEFDFVEIAHGGSSEPGGGLYALANLGIENGDRAKVTNSIFRNSAGYGLYVESGGILEAFANNEFKDNAGVPLVVDATQVSKLDEASTFNSGNGDNSVEIHGSSVLDLGATEVTWVALSNGTPYYLSGNVSIRSGLIINAGANFEVGTDARITIENNGYMGAEGTSGNMISFTGKTKSPGAWRGIGFFTNDVRNVMNYTIIKHGGSSELGLGLYDRFNVGVENGDRLTVTNSTISDSAGYGIYAEGGSTLSSSGNTFSSNALGNTN